MKKMRWTKVLLGIAAMSVIFYVSAFSCMAAEGKVTADTAKIREKADTGSAVVGSTVKGKVIDILEAVKDGSGTVWYKVPIANNQYGYIRSDLVETKETLTPKSSASSETSQSNSSNAEESKPEATVPTSIGEQQATIKSDTSVRIRSGASTKHDAVTALPNGTTITLIGEATDSAGNKWYQLTCDYNGKKVEGYVRSDLIAIGGTSEAEGTAEGDNTDSEGEEQDNPDGEEGAEGAPEEGEEGSEAEAPEEAVEEEHNDYEIVYTQNDAGEYEYYFYDNIEGTRQKLGELLNVVDIANETNQKLQEQKEQDKIIIIILAVVIVILFVVITILIFKIRDLYYEEYDEDEDEEEEEEPAPIRKKARRREEDDYEEPVPVRKKRPVTTESPMQDKQAQPRTSQSRASQSRASQSRPKPKERPDGNGTQTRNPAPKPKTRRPQNFLVDDDEFEFEFLNMDDKDL